MPNGNNVDPTTSDSVNQQIADQVSEAQDVYDALDRFSKQQLLLSGTVP